MKATNVQNTGHITIWAEGEASMQQWMEPTKLTEDHHSLLLRKHAKSWKEIILGLTLGSLAVS